MSNILFISPADLSGADVPNGGTYGSKIHVDLLESLPDAHITVLSVSRRMPQNTARVTFIPATANAWSTLIANCRGYAGYLTKEAEDIVFQQLKTGKYDMLFLDTSNYGRIAKQAKKVYPLIKIVSFFHNVEYKYMFAIMRIQGLHYLPAFLSSWYNEKLTAQYSDICIAINERDKDIIEKKYKRIVDGMLPPWYEEYIIPEESKMAPVSKPLKVLFFGSWFFANIAGIKWFIQNVLPLADIQLIVAGRGMEALRDFYPESEKLLIGGTVKDPEEVYSNADCVAAPIFDGSGMKVKTGEALRYGKTVVGTREAFTGYHITNGLEGYICEAADEFVMAFKKISDGQPMKVNEASYLYFKEHLSKQAAIKKLKVLLGFK
jgi:glycosyltransferase involved in cell wall biosynthesis